MLETDASDSEFRFAYGSALRWAIFVHQEPPF
jgi:hypothetical protein